MLPGYKHVPAFGPDEEYEEEVEVSYVTVDLGPNVDKDLLPNTSEYRLAGLDSSTPMIQLSGTFFQGSHEELIGTEILFTDGRDEANPSRRFVVPVATTSKRIRFEKVEVQRKDDFPPVEIVAPKPKPIASRSLVRTTGRGHGRGRPRGKVGGKSSVKGKEREEPMDVDVTSTGE
ncbi:hypothetical protein BU17DRAFT_78679 [Hysterangium stoloniferum]|nr:hypothetical protein BU17DRAFT_78679 [Hysterangium stoloniferum]